MLSRRTKFGDSFVMGTENRMIEVDIRPRSPWNRGRSYLGFQSRRQIFRSMDAWRREGIPAPVSLRPRWHTYDRASRKAGVIVWLAGVPMRYVNPKARWGAIPTYFVVNGVPFSPRR